MMEDDSIEVMAMQIALFQLSQEFNGSYFSISRLANMEIELSRKFGPYEAQEALKIARKTAMLFGVEED